ncbi:hypothetical protein V5O48_016402 [Marasmius crinis-equi]|uniref:Myb-like domain-containing protein n=1 Tax=Marasmius crinis-equi TaxID=585013 RepID=A0ABR3ERS8_9AGAR
MGDVAPIPTTTPVPDDKKNQNEAPPTTAHNDVRAQTLKALETYISTQRSLLSQTREDIERLRELRRGVLCVGGARGVIEGMNARDEDGKMVVDTASPSAPTPTPTPKLESDEEDIDLDLRAPEFSLSRRVSECFDLNLEDKENRSGWGWGWEAFSGSCDPTRLYTLKTQHVQEIQRIKDTSLACLPPLPLPPPHPPLVPPTTTTPLTTYIRNARSSIIDPVFDKYGLSYNPEPLPPDKEEGKETQKEREHRKIRELKKRKIGGGGRGGRAGGGCAGLRVGARKVEGEGEEGGGEDGVFVRKDVGDESMDVDVDVGVVGGVGPQKAKPKPKPKKPKAVPRTLIPPPLPMVLTKSPRVRRPSVRASLVERERVPMPMPVVRLTVKPPPTPKLTIVIPGMWHPRRTARGSTATTEEVEEPGPFSEEEEDEEEGEEDGESEVEEEDEEADEEDPEPPPTPLPMDIDDDDDADASASSPKPLKPRKQKPKPDTYKQPWSTSEQHLLERLLEEIPEGAKNRWKQISVRMGGRRTPRQVASRVQKWVEKLRRFDLV